MKVSLDEIKKVFNDLIEEKKSREQIASWASTRQQAEDRGELEFEPSTEEKRIWEAILYLMGVDLIRDLDGNYLHSVQNFIDFKNELGL